MIFVYLIIVAIVALFGYKYILGGKEAMQARRNERFQRKADEAWQKQFKANMADIDEHWDGDHPISKKQKISVRGAFKCYEDAWRDNYIIN